MITKNKPTLRSTLQSIWESAKTQPVHETAYAMIFVVPILLFTLPLRQAMVEAARSAKQSLRYII
jgi:hypothetical protein